MNPLILEIQSCNLGYRGKSVIRDLSLTIPSRSIYALIGPNGAGKSTFLGALLNQIPQASGDIRIFGQPAQRLGRAQKARIGFVADGQDLPDWLTGEQYLAYCRAIQPHWDDAFSQRLESILNFPRSQKIRNMSRGERMKTALFGAMGFRPQLLIMDEPFSGLDPHVRHQLITALLAFSDELDWSIIISSHDVEEVERIADTVGFLHNGNLQFSEETESLRGRFQRIVVRAEGGDTSAPNPSESAICIERDNNLLRFVETQFSADSPWNEQRGVDCQPMSLREIFIALSAQHQLSQASR